MNRTIVLAMRVLACALLAEVCSAADLSGNYIAQVTRGTAAAQFARVNLNVQGTRVSGLWGQYSVEGTVTGTKVTLKLAEKNGKSAGELSGSVTGDVLAGDGNMAPTAGNGLSGRASAMLRSTVLLAWFSSEIAASMRSGVAAITFTGILSRAPSFCLSEMARQTLSAASLLAGESSRWASTNSHSE